MTREQKIEVINTMTDKLYDENMIVVYMDSAEAIIMQKAYPFGNAPAVMPMQYDRTHIDVAVYLLNKRGAEGETTHTENGVSRTYESSDVPQSMLRGIIPRARTFGGGV